MGLTKMRSVYQLLMFTFIIIMNNAFFTSGLPKMYLVETKDEGEVMGKEEDTDYKFPFGSISLDWSNEEKTENTANVFKGIQNVNNKVNAHGSLSLNVGDAG